MYGRARSRKSVFDRGHAADDRRRQLRWELDKAVWETLSGTEKLTLYVRPEDVMPLTE